MLKIDGPRNITFGEGFLKLTDMNILDLSGITGHCSFQKISQGFFKYLPNLTYIDVSACEILHVDDGAFGSLPFLKHLDISHNKRLGFASLPNITKNLEKTAIEIFRFNGINCLTGTGTKIRTCHLINLKDTKITELYIEKNRLEQFEAGAIKVLPKTLKKVSLGENKLTQGKYMIDYFSVESVRIFNISVQLRPAPFPWSIFENCIEKHDDCEFTFSENDRRTDAERSTDILFRTNDKRLITFNIPRSAEIIYANSSRLYTAIPEFGINSKGFREFYLQHNFFYSWIGPFMNDIEGKIFENMHSLRILDLSFDNINVLPTLMFKNLQELQELNLKGNLLFEWRVKMDHMRKIKLINLARNRLTTINMHQQSAFGSLFLISSLTIDISENKLLCSCENLQFLSWITAYRMHFKQFKSYQCSMASSKTFDFSNASSSLLTLRRNCKSFLLIYLLISVALAFLMSIMIGVIIVKNKWKIIYFIFKVKKRLGKIGTLSKEIGPMGYDYHAFISFSDDMKDFVVDVMIPRLQTRSNLRFFIRDRDDVHKAGQSEYTVIMEAIEKSRRVICLLSDEYLKSDIDKYRVFEITIARWEGVKRGKSLKFIHIILFPKVKIDSLPGILLTILKQNSYLEYPKEECAYDVFWEKFQSLIEQDVMSDMEQEIKPTIMQDDLSDIEKDFVCDTEPLITPDIEQG
ncbi:toll-like receptor 4 [Saccostrea echinata]|uniref:toll-like receptor 4 n=1 Tax=Saccostrea echinata TaxID=191078 RepID=UPI002A823F35|nr:toll-like receptor 4 [Saccostrea echinata]